MNKGIFFILVVSCCGLHAMSAEEIASWKKEAAGWQTIEHPYALHQAVYNADVAQVKTLVSEVPSAVFVADDFNQRPCDIAVTCYREGAASKREAYAQILMVLSPKS